MTEKAMLVPLPGDGPAAQEILAEVKRLMEKRRYRPLGKKVAGEFADRLRHARYLDQQSERRRA